MIEIDGGTHDFDSELKRDRAREAWLEARGYRVIRFSNEQVLRQLEGVLTVIAEASRGGFDKDHPPP